MEKRAGGIAEWAGGGWRVVAGFSVLPGLAEGLVMGAKDGHFSALMFVLGDDAADGGMQTHGVLVPRQSGSQSQGLFHIQRNPRP
jgi:hypothetical protein